MYWISLQSSLRIFEPQDKVPVMWVASTLGSNVVVMLSAPCFCLTTSDVSNSSHNILTVIFDTLTRDDRQQYNQKKTKIEVKVSMIMIGASSGMQHM